MRFSEAINHKVIDTTSADQLGHVDGFIVDPEHARIVGIRLGKAKGKALVIGWEDLQAFGADAVMVRGDGGPREATEEEQRTADLDLPGHRVLTDRGRELGTVDDVEFEPTSGRIEAILVGGVSLPGDRAIGLGRYALVVREAPS